MVGVFALVSTQCLDATAPREGRDLLGLWSTSSPPPRSGVFAPQDTLERAVSLWRVALPSDLGLAAVRTGEAEAILAAAQLALAGSLDRLRAFTLITGRGVAFGSPGNPTWSGQPEAMLAGLLRQASPVAGVAFGAGEQLIADWREVARQFRCSGDQLAAAVRAYAWFETHAGDRRIGWTVGSWSGDLSTCWSAGVTIAEAELHHRSLRLALGSRAALIRMADLVARGAVLLAAAMPSSVSPILAMPAAWRFIKDVVDEFQARLRAEADE